MSWLIFVVSKLPLKQLQEAKLTKMITAQQKQNFYHNLDLLFICFFSGKSFTLSILVQQGHVSAQAEKLPGTSSVNIWSNASV